MGLVLCSLCEEADSIFGASLKTYLYSSTLSTFMA